MTKNLRKLFCASVLCLFAMTAFASEPSTGYTVTEEPITNLIKSRIMGPVGYDTDIVIINYTNTDFYLTSPATALIQHGTSARIRQQNYVYDTAIRLENAYGQQFFYQYVHYQDTISVYVYNNQYVVYVTT